MCVCVWRGGSQPEPGIAWNKSTPPSTIFVCSIKGGNGEEEAGCDREETRLDGGRLIGRLGVWAEGCTDPNGTHPHRWRETQDTERRGRGGGL